MSRIYNYSLLRVELLEDRSVPVVLPAGFGESLVTGGLTNPTNLAVTPDGRVFVTEQGGTLRVIQNGALLPTPFVSLTVDSAGERGLLGVTFDPNFTANGFVYVYYTVPGSGGAAPHNRVSRFTANGNVALPGSEVPLLDLEPLSSATNHNGGGIHFGLDGKLYVAVGENANPAHAQTLSNRLGKVLRINPNGTIPTDNPFVGVPGAREEIWSLGLRNPFSFAVQAGTGRMFINDVGSGGSGVFEEVNVNFRGANYGWPQTEGPNPPGVPGVTYPLYSYPHDGDPLFTGSAITGGAFYNPPALSFPAPFVGAYFFTDLTGGWINRLDPQTGAVANFASDLTGQLVVGLDVTPGGDLLYVARNVGTGGGGVFRIGFTASGAAIAVGPGPGGGPVGLLSDPSTGAPLLAVPAFDPAFRGGVRVATADVTGDGTRDLVIGAGVGGGPQVRVFDGATGALVRNFFALDPTFTGGLFVAAADFDRDGFADVVVSPDEGGGPRVQVFSGRDGTLLANFFGITDTGFRGGARVAAGDINADGVPDLVVAAGTGGGPRVAAFDGQTIRPGVNPTKLFNDFFAFEPVLRDGVYVAIGDADDDGVGDLIVGAGPGGAPRVVVFSGARLAQGPGPALAASFFAGDANARNGVPVAARNVDADTAAEIITGTASGPTTGAPPRVSLFKLSGGVANPLRDFLAFDAAFTGGVFVG
jgi:glucose/arabinose dehydrogenase